MLCYDSKEVGIELALRCGCLTVTVLLPPLSPTPLLPPTVVHNTALSRGCLHLILVPPIPPIWFRTEPSTFRRSFLHLRIDDDADNIPIQVHLKL